MDWTIVDEIRVLVGPECLSYCDSILKLTLHEAVTKEVVDKVKSNIFFGIELKPEDDIIEYHGNELIIKAHNYALFKKLHRAFQELGGIEIKSATITPTEVDFTYILANGRHVLNNDELEIIQNVIDPTIKFHDSIRITGFVNEKIHQHEYSFRATVNKKCN